MKVYTMTALGMIFCALSGCDRSPAVDLGRVGDIKLVSMVDNIAVENAIIAQHTLYPYHFEQDGAKLNELGLSDLDVLIRHFRDHAGTLNIHRGKTGGDVYEARLLYVIDKMRENGIERDRVVIQDGMPGGSGMASEQVVKVLEKAATTPLKDYDRGMGQSR